MSKYVLQIKNTETGDVFEYKPGRPLGRVVFSDPKAKGQAKPQFATIWPDKNGFASAGLSFEAQDGETEYGPRKNAALAVRSVMDGEGYANIYFFTPKAQDKKSDDLTDL